MSHLLVVPVLLPAFAAALLALLHPPAAIQRGASIAVGLVLLVVAARLLLDVDAGVPLAYALGNWRPPFGIVLVADRLSALMLLLTALLILPVLVAAAAGEDRQGRYFHALLQFQLMGLNGAFLTGDLFNLFVFFEVLLIASYCLLLHGNSAGRVRAALHYVVINLVGSSLFLIAVAMLYAVTGTLNLADLAVKVALLAPQEQVLAHSGALLLLVVFCLKAALFPLFLWLPPTYVNASAPVAALFAVMTKVGIYAILRVYLLVFGESAGSAAPDLQRWLLPAALITMACAALAALASRRLNGIAAHLTLLSVGTALTGAAFATPAAVSAALYYVAHSTLAGALLFLVCGVVGAQRNSAGDSLKRAAPLPRPQLTALLFFLSGVAVAGMPPLSGFVGKTMLLQATSGMLAAPWVWTLILLTSFLSILVLARAGLVVFWSVRTREPAGQPNAAAGFAAPMLLLALVAALALAAEPVKRFTDATAAQLADTASYIELVLTMEGRP